MDSSIEEIYKEYKLKGYLDSTKLYKQKHDDFGEGTIVKHFKSKFNISEEEFYNLIEKYKNIPEIKSKFTETRREAFGNDDEAVIRFYNWYTKQKQICDYCGISQSELHKVFTNDDKKILPLNSNWSKNIKGTLQIERKNSVCNTYDENNIVLACPLCNNAKSNLIDELSWRKFFAAPMREYYESLLVKKLDNPLPEDTKKVINSSN